MLFDNYRCVKNYSKGVRKSDNFSKEDIIDRTGYIPIDLQYYRMMEAGTNLTRVIDSQYNFDWKDLESSYNNGTLSVDEVTKGRIIKRFNDMTVLHDEAVSLIEKYKSAKTDFDKISALKSKYEKDLEIEDIRKQAINEYVASQKQKVDNTNNTN